MNITLRNKMHARMDEVRAQVAERDDLIETIAIALLTRKNVFILGDTGRPRATPSTCSAPALPGPDSLSG